MNPAATQDFQQHLDEFRQEQLKRVVAFLAVAAWLLGVVFLFVRFSGAALIMLCLCEGLCWLTYHLANHGRQRLARHLFVGGLMAFTLMLAWLGKNPALLFVPVLAGPLAVALLAPRTAAAYIGALVIGQVVLGSQLYPESMFLLLAPLLVILATGLALIDNANVLTILGWAETMGQASDEAVAQQMAQMPPPIGLGERTAKPIICAINGPVEGGGCEMALACDFRFIARDAFMGQPEVNAGFPPGGGGTQRLTRMLGVSKAMELCLTGRRIYPDEAERLGLVVKACDPEELLPTVMNFARALAAKPPVGMAKIKQAIYQGVGLPLRDGLMLERKLFFEAIRSEDALRLMRAYVAVGQDRQKLAELMASQQA